MPLSSKYSLEQVSLNTAVGFKTAEDNLRKHALKALFVQSLDWESCEQLASHTFSSTLQSSTLQSSTLQSSTLQSSTLQSIPIAQKEGVTVWQILLSKAVSFTPTLKQQVYSALAELPSESNREEHAAQPPLVIFINAEKTCSLWCQAANQQPLCESVLYVSQQPISLWRYRLKRLAKSNRGLFRSLNVEIYKTFELLLDNLCDRIVGISNVTDRQSYAALTLQRMILIQAVQQKGWLNGSTWYLQTRFGKALQEGRNFFATDLQPLYQSLSLPRIERPLPLSETVGDVPFLGYLFHTHRVEQIYADISIENLPFEEILGWLSEQSSADGLDPWMGGELGYCLEKQLLRQQTTIEPADELIGEQAAPLSGVELARWVSDRTLNPFLINKIQPETNPSTTLNDLLFNADAKVCRYLIQEVLPNLRILDPACGSGNLLVIIYQQLVEIFSVLIGHSQHSQDKQLQIWRSELTAEERAASVQFSTEKESSLSASLLQNVQKRILKDNLCGVDISVQATESTIFQLLLHTVTTANKLQDIEPLADLSFNILSGNSLIGLINVDEERFEKINGSGDSDIFQGNLLQTLVADSYQTIMAEKNLAVEHYKSRNQTLAEANNIPDYARAALLKEDILRLDIKAQSKLDNLLLSQMSQQLGIQYKAAQLTEKPQRRPLTLEDIDILQPFHWGYHFNTVLKRGGFDIIVCAPPLGSFKPTTTEFLQKFQDLAKVKGISARSLKTSKQALAKGDPEIAQAWLFYQDQYAYVADYFYRSEQYKYQNPTVDGKIIRNQLTRERLFIEQCFNLISAKGVCAIVLSKKLSEQPKAQTLQSFLATKSKLVEFIARTSPDEEAVVVVFEYLSELSTWPD